MDALFTLDHGVATRGQGSHPTMSRTEEKGVPTRGHPIVTYQAQALLATQDASLSACVFVFVTSRGSAHLGAVWHGPQPGLACQTGGTVVSTTCACPSLIRLELLLWPTCLKMEGQFSQPCLWQGSAVLGDRVALFLRLLTAYS